MLVFWLIFIGNFVGPSHRIVADHNTMEPHVLPRLKAEFVQDCFAIKGQRITQVHFCWYASISGLGMTLNEVTKFLDEHSHRNTSFVPSMNALRKLLPRCMAHRFLTSSLASSLADPNLASSSLRHCSTRRLNFFCVDAELEVEEANIVQLIRSGFFNPSALAVSRSLANSDEYPSLCCRQNHQQPHLSIAQFHSQTLH